MVFAVTVCPLKVADAYSVPAFVSLLKVVPFELAVTPVQDKEPVVTLLTILPLL